MPRTNPKQTPAASQGAPSLQVPGGPDFHVDFQNADLPDPKLQRLHAIWHSKCRSGRLPGRADFDPVELPPELLPWITIFDVEGARFRIRLVGTGIVEALGTDTTGRYADDLPNTHALQVRARWAVENARPYFMTNLPIPWDQERYSRYSVLCAPLASNGVDVDKLLYLMSFDH
jgi:hypothetical protein